MVQSDVSNRRFQHLLLFCGIILCCNKALAFSRPPFVSTCRQHSIVSQSSLSMIGGALFSEPVKTLVSKTDEVFDKNGKRIVVGDVVRITVDGLKQFQIPTKGFGSFDSQKNFVKDESTDKSIKKYFALPIGLRGVVIKVYNIDEVSANFPVQVRFESGKHIEEGYDPPSPFTMHFMTNEIECL
jgi:hypothetical protein